MDKIKVELSKTDVCLLLTACSQAESRYKMEEIEERKKKEDKDLKRVEKLNNMSGRYTELWHKLMDVLEAADG